MEAKIVTRDSICLIGMGFYGDPCSNASAWSEENEIGRLWKRFMGFWHKSPELIPNVKDHNVALEVHIETAETKEKGYFEIFIGVIVEELKYLPLECVAKVLPPTQYAVFTLKGEEITADWGKKIYQDWLPASDYQLSYNYNIQYYDQRFKGMDKIAESTVDLYLPVVPLNHLDF